MEECDWPLKRKALVVKHLVWYNLRIQVILKRNVHFLKQAFFQSMFVEGKILLRRKTGNLAKGCSC